MKKLKYKKLEVMQPRKKKQIRTSATWITILDQSTQGFTAEID